MNRTVGRKKKNECIMDQELYTEVLAGSWWTLLHKNYAYGRRCMCAPPTAALF